MTNDNVSKAQHSANNVIDLAELRAAKAESEAIARDQFGDGPWKREPNSAEWVDKDSGYPCAILRNPMLGHLCGYVGVFKGHPAFGRDYRARVMDGVRVHGGVNYSSFKGERHLIAVTPTTPWWFGFDCAHAGDVVPALDAGVLKKFKAEALAALPREYREALERFAPRGDTYRSFAWVTGEVGVLCAQLRALE